MAEQTKKISVKEAQDEALAIVTQEKRRWEDVTSWVTDRVAFRMRPLIRLLRKNYWGVFDYPIDQVTGRQKTWVPLTMTTVENVVKSIDLDTKDITFRAKNPNGYAITEIIRAAVRDYLDKDRFGEMIDDLARDIAINGTAIWKTVKYKDKEGDTQIKTLNVDLLNWYIDPNEKDIQSAYRVTERARLVPSEIAQMDGWENVKDLAASQSLSSIDSQYKQLTPGTTAEYRDVWETWGKIPKWLVTLSREDKESGEEIEGHLVVSGIEAGGGVCHLIETNEDGLKPYEECRYSKISNRWYGVGIAERLMWLQVWLNTNVNIRINRGYVSQLGLFKIKKGSGITPAMISRLSANGAVLVSDMDDINPLKVPPNDNTSYQDENRILDWSQKVTSAYDIAVGGETSASSTATSNQLQNTNAKTAFQLVKEEMGMFIERWMNRHALPVIAKTIGEGDIVRFSMEEDSFKEIVQRVVSYEAMNKLEEMYEAGFIPTAETMQREIQSAEEKILKQKDLFVENLEEIIAEHCDTKVHVTSEDLDTSVIVTNLMQALQIAPEYKDQIIKEAFDLMGLPTPKANAMPPMQPGMQPGQPGQSTQMGMAPGIANQTPEAIKTGASVANQMGLRPR